MIRIIKKILKNTDLYTIQQVIKIGNENNVEELELRKSNNNFVRIVYK